MFWYLKPNDEITLTRLRVLSQILCCNWDGRICKLVVFQSICSRHWSNFFVSQTVAQSLQVCNSSLSHRTPNKFATLTKNEHQQNCIRNGAMQGRDKEAHRLKNQSAHSSLCRAGQTPTQKKKGLHVIQSATRFSHVNQCRLQITEGLSVESEGTRRHAQNDSRSRRNKRIVETAYNCHCLLKSYVDFQPVSKGANNAACKCSGGLQ